MNNSTIRYDFCVKRRYSRRYQLWEYAFINHCKSYVMFHFFKRKQEIPTLKELDELYGNTIANLDEEIRYNYCIGLIWRSKDDMKNMKKKEEVKRLRQVINAANREVELLKPLLEDVSKNP